MTATAPRSMHFMIGSHRIEAAALPPALYLVATPIGNLSDITIRALETLAAVDILACEDTRTTRVLLDRYGINRKLIAYHEHNEAAAAGGLIDAIRSGQSVAIASDAGTPLVSDPGYRLVQAAIEAGIAVVPIPGASAVLAGLQMSGLPSDSFSFAGFLPAKSGQRKTKLTEWANNSGTVLYFESPRRLAASLNDMAETLGPDRPAAVCREITKKFEEARRGMLQALAEHYAEAGAPRGECVIAVGPGGAGPQLDETALDDLLSSLVAEMPASRAAAEAAKQTGLAKRDLYQRLLDLKDANG